MRVGSILMRLGYARKSKGEPESLEMQISRLKKAGADEILSDIRSGRTEERRQFKHLLALIESGKITEILVTRVDRLGRSLVTLCRVLAILEDKKIKLTVLDAPVSDPTSPFGWYNLTQMSLNAEFESRMMSNRIKHGMDYLREQGRTFKPVFGYKRSEDGKLVSDETLQQPCGLTSWQIAQKSVDIYLEVGNLRRAVVIIWERYQVKWSVPGFRDWLRNPQIRGNTAYNTWHNRNQPEQWDIRHNSHPALITEEIWQQIEFLLKRGRAMWGIKANSPTAMNYPLAGQIFCGVCGSKCYRYAAGNKREVLRCRKRDEGAQFCSNRQSTPLEDIERSVIEKLVARAEEVARLISQPQDVAEPPRLKELRQQLAGLLALGRNPAIFAAAEEVRSQIQNEEAKLHHTQTHQQDLFKLLEAFADPEYFKSETRQNRTILYRQMVDRVIVKDASVVEVELKV